VARPSQIAHRLKQGVLDVAARSLRRYGYELAPVARSDGGPPTPGETIPCGRTEPFTTAEYDVLPKGRFDVARHDYYSPIPDLSALPGTVWQRQSDMAGVAISSLAGMTFIESELQEFIAEMRVPLRDPGEPGVFFLNNHAFESVDAELLYGMIRALRPRRVVELGSGYSTLVIDMAAKRNADEGVPTQHVSYDPYPRQHVLGSTASGPTLEQISATDLPLSTFTDLDVGDVLFVDTTHTVKLASDVNFIVLDVLPRLRPGVVVHFHDIFLPWEYPKVWFSDMGYFWNEQYLLQAFLAFNAGFQIVIPAQAVAREHPKRLQHVIPSFATGASPASMWIMRVTGYDDDGDAISSITRHIHKKVK